LALHPPVELPLGDDAVRLQHALRPVWLFQAVLLWAAPFSLEQDLLEQVERRA